MFGGRRERLDANRERWQQFSDISGPMVAGLITSLQDKDGQQFDEYWMQLKTVPTVPLANLILFSYGLAEDLYSKSELKDMPTRDLLLTFVDYIDWWVPKESTANLIGLREIMENKRQAGKQFDMLAMMMFAYVLCAYLLPPGGAAEHVRQFCNKLPPDFLVVDADKPVTPYPRKGGVDPS